MISNAPPSRCNSPRRGSAAIPTQLSCKAMADTLVINEIYLSLQGESTFAGLPCIFIRLTACNLRCSYCDTAYAFNEGKKTSFAEIGKAVSRLSQPYENSASIHQRLPLIEFTGGEPLLQTGSI